MGCGAPGGDAGEGFGVKGAAREVRESAVCALLYKYALLCLRISRKSSTL